MTSLIFDILHPPIRGQQFALELIRQPMRPRDLNQWAKRMVDIATGAGAIAAEQPCRRTCGERKGQRPDSEGFAIALAEAFDCERDV
jgi:hypothetical protein